MTESTHSRLQNYRVSYQTLQNKTRVDRNLNNLIPTLENGHQTYQTFLDSSIAPEEHVCRVREAFIGAIRRVCPLHLLPYGEYKDVRLAIHTRKRQIDLIGLINVSARLPPVVLAQNHNIINKFWIFLALIQIELELAGRMLEDALLPLITWIVRSMIREDQIADVPDTLALVLQRYPPRFPPQIAKPHEHAVRRSRHPTQFYDLQRNAKSKFPRLSHVDDVTTRQARKPLKMQSDSTNNCVSFTPHSSLTLPSPPRRSAEAASPTRVPITKSTWIPSTEGTTDVDTLGGSANYFPIKPTIRSSGRSDSSTPALMCGAARLPGTLDPNNRHDKYCGKELLVHNKENIQGTHTPFVSKSESVERELTPSNGNAIRSVQPRRQVSGQTLDKLFILPAAQFSPSMGPQNRAPHLTPLSCLASAAAPLSSNLAHNNDHNPYPSTTATGLGGQLSRNA